MFYLDRSIIYSKPIFHIPISMVCFTTTLKPIEEKNRENKKNEKNNYLICQLAEKKNNYFLSTEITLRIIKNKTSAEQFHLGNPCGLRQSMNYETDVSGRCPTGDIITER